MRLGGIAVYLLVPSLWFFVASLAAADAGKKTAPGYLCDSRDPKHKAEMRLLKTRKECKKHGGQWVYAGASAVAKNPAEAKKTEQSNGSLADEVQEAMQADVEVAAKPGAAAATSTAAGTSP